MYIIVLIEIVTNLYFFFLLFLSFSCCVFYIYERTVGLTKLGLCGAYLAYYDASPLLVSVNHCLRLQIKDKIATFKGREPSEYYVN